MMNTQEEIERQQKEKEIDKLRSHLVDIRTDEKAEELYSKYFEKDPFPHISPALLNSADIFKYVEMTGMLQPFHVEDLSGATYEVRIKGEVIWWDEKDKRQHSKQLEKPGDYFRLEPNSIAFITLEPYFRIPDYMALRFNLKIVHIYKGLLLGTGPLVDPGFKGRLSIPLHNLTANTYVFHFNDGIIQMEFTKLSQYSAWADYKNDKGLEDDPKRIFYFYKRKWFRDGRDLKYYIAKALNGSDNTVVKSAFPKEIEKIKKISRKTKKDVDKRIASQDKKLGSMQLITILTLIPVLAFACTAIYQLGSVNNVKKEQIAALNKQVDGLEKDKEEMKTKLSEMEDVVEKLEKELIRLEVRK